jgi:hypothetical protein
MDNRPIHARLALLLAVGVLFASVGPVAAIHQPTVGVSDGTVIEGNQTTVTVVLERVPDGLRLYNLTVSVTDPRVAEVVGADSGDIPFFQVRSLDDDEVTFRGVDVGSVGPGDGPVTLAVVTFRGESAGTTALDVEVNVLTDDQNDTYTPHIRPGSLVVADNQSDDDDDAGPVVFPGGDPANDLDDDGSYEDVNGDGRASVADVQALFAKLESTPIQNNPAAFDFNGDGRVSISDVQALFVAL